VTSASEPVDDLTAFQHRIDLAMSAFRHDSAYAVSMARAAVVITNKRRAGRVRKTLRDAELAAHAECLAAGAFDCHAVSPCGVGDCKFATGALAALTVDNQPGLSRRPQLVNTGGYSMQPAVNALMAQLSPAPQRVS
jgi:hypothetical protein